MNSFSCGATRAILLIALPLGGLTASAQNLTSSITTFDKYGNPTTYATAPSGVSSGVTVFDPNGVPINLNTTPVNVTPPNVAGTIANQNIYLPGGAFYSRFNYGYQTPYPYPVYPAPSYGYPVQNPAYTVPLGGAYNNGSGPFGPTTVTVIPNGQTYAYGPTYPAPVYPYPAYPYSVPNYGYYGYGSVSNSYSNQSSQYGASFGENGLRISVGGSNSSGSSYSTRRRR